MWRLSFGLGQCTMPSQKYWHVSGANCLNLHPNTSEIQEDGQNPFSKVQLRFKLFQAKMWPMQNESGSPKRDFR